MIGKVKYVGKSFGAESLTNNKIYDVIEIDEPFIRIIDDSGEDYLYAINSPGDLQNSKLCGEWELIETTSERLKQLLSTK